MTSRSTPHDSEFQVGPETAMVLNYRVFDAEGDLVEAARERTVVFGAGALLPAVERRLEGRCAGFTCAVDLAAREAFGPRYPDRIIEVDRAEFPDDAEVGDRFIAEDEGGSPLVLSVLELNEETARVDTNHPLAGQTIRVELEVTAVRLATLAELSAAETRFSAAGGPAATLISPERLLRGRTQRYDSAADAGVDEAEPPAEPRDPAEGIVGEADKPKIA